MNTMLAAFAQTLPEDTHAAFDARTYVSVV
jgi:hypothetical protein